jgi:hypothetical protein
MILLFVTIPGSHSGSEHGELGDQLWGWSFGLIRRRRGPITRGRDGDAVALQVRRADDLGGQRNGGCARAGRHSGALGCRAVWALVRRGVGP